MPPLFNARHEAFAQNIVKGLPGSTAYERAGYRTSGNGSEVNASKLLRDAKVAARIAELQERGAERTLVTLESLTQELDEARALALKEGQTSAAVAAAMGKAKLHGFLVERSENVNTNYTISDAPLSDAEWAEQHTEH